MKRLLTISLLFAIMIFLVAGCGVPEPQIIEKTIVVTQIIEKEIIVEGESIVMEFTENDDAEEAIVADDSAETTIDSNRSPLYKQGTRLIIKDGKMTLEVQSTDSAVDKAVNIIIGMGGYIIENRVYQGESNYKFATLQFGIPADQFELAMRELAKIGLVLNESASGNDVTDEYVDLNSKLGNLEATQERLRSFLLDSEHVAEALAVNTELRDIEEELSIIKGRINYISERAAFSTIRLQINPFIPTPTPSPTPPPPTPLVWAPGHTAQIATYQLIDNSQSIADLFIYFVISALPFLLLLLLVGLGVRRVVKKVKRSRPRPPITN